MCSDNSSDSYHYYKYWIQIIFFLLVYIQMKAKQSKAKQSKATNVGASFQRCPNQTMSQHVFSHDNHWFNSGARRMVGSCHPLVLKGDVRKP
jgi:hypothetical protein